MDFSSIVSRAGIGLGVGIEVRACPDQYIGTVAEVSQGNFDSFRRPISSRPKGSSAIIVLESPHVNEFQGLIGPAKGKTGVYLSMYAGYVLGDVASDTSIVLVNAVQYQCSLGKPTREYRDVVFRAVWSNGGREDFIERLLIAYRPGDFIICSCTKGGGKNSNEYLRNMVYKAIREVLPRATVSGRTHPCAWNTRRNREYQWA